VNFKQTVKLSHFEGGLYALMVASTESFLFYYAVTMNVTSFELAILATLPLALGALSQMFIPKLIADKNLGSSIVWTMLFQLLGVLGILHTVAINYSFDRLLFFTCIHFMGGLTSTPLWIDWASKIIPKRNFRKYMAHRSSYTWYLILFFYVGLALIGQYFKNFNIVYIFLVGAIARFLSCALQAHIIRGEFAKKIKKQAIEKASLPRIESIQEIPADTLKLIWTFIIWTSIFRLSVYISSPFFTPYMMNDLKLSMPQYVILSSIPYFGRALFFNRWGRAGAHHGAFYGIQLSALYISFIPIIWILTRSYSLLIFTEILAGICWGGFELNQVLMIQNFMHHSMKEGSRVLLGINMALANFFGVIGGVIGSVLLDAKWSFYQVFLISSILRFLTVFILIKKANMNQVTFKNYIRKILPL
jgi:MFS family permease